MNFSWYPSTEWLKSLTNMRACVNPEDVCTETSSRTAPRQERGRQWVIEGSVSCWARALGRLEDRRWRSSRTFSSCEIWAYCSAILDSHCVRYLLCCFLMRSLLSIDVVALSAFCFSLGSAATPPPSLEFLTLWLARTSNDPEVILMHTSRLRKIAHVVLLVKERAS